MPSEEDSFERKLFPMTTIINGRDSRGNCWQGSGFFYTEMIPQEPEKQGPQWHKIDKTWLITNRHVVLAKENGMEYLPERLTFHLRETKKGCIDWIPIELSKEDLRVRLKLHKNSDVDVACIDISSYIHDIISDNEKRDSFLPPLTLSNLNLPSNQPIKVEVTSDIIIASYPKNFYDDTNKFPIVKSGIVASAWGFQFKGEPIFQIDAQLFPGSSGGLVISKPTHFALIDGKPHYSKSKEFVLLGIYSGEYCWKESITIPGIETPVEINRTYGLGNVWYSYLIPEIISEGVQFM